MDTDDTAGVSLISGFASPDLPSQYVYHIFAKQYIFSENCECKSNVMICWIIFMILSRLWAKNIIEGSDDNFHLYSNPVLLKYFMKSFFSCPSRMFGL